MTQFIAGGIIMSKRFFVDHEPTDEGKYRVVQEDSETQERFGVKDFDTKEEAQKSADDLQKTADHTFSEDITMDNIEIPLSIKDETDAVHENKYKDTLQDLKGGTSQD
jgi:hypothetical protein